VWSVAFSADGARLASGSYDRTVRLWRTNTGALIQTLTGHSEAVVAVAFSSDGRWLASGGDDKKIRMWHAGDGSLARTLAGESECVYSLAFSPDSRWLGSGSRERSALGEVREKIFGRGKGAENGRTIRLWRARNGTLAGVLAEHAGDVHGLAFSRDGKWMASSSDDKTVKLWSVNIASAGR
jgi:WD40 repeat protein